MAQTKLKMRHLQEILRLKHQNQLSVREIARSCGLPTSTVGDYLKRAAAAGIGWPLPEGQSEEELSKRLAQTHSPEPSLWDRSHNDGYGNIEIMGRPRRPAALLRGKTDFGPG